MLRLGQVAIGATAASCFLKPEAEPLNDLSITYMYTIYPFSAFNPFSLYCTLLIFCKC